MGLYRMEFTWNWYGRGLCMGYTTLLLQCLFWRKFLLSWAVPQKLLFFWLLLGQAAAIAVVLLKFVYYTRLESWAAEHHHTMFIFNALCVDSLELSRDMPTLNLYLLHILTSIWMIIFWINCPRHQAYCMSSHTTSR